MVEEVCCGLNDKRSEHGKIKENNNIGREGTGAKAIRLEGSRLLALKNWEVVVRCMQRSLQRPSRYTS